MKIGRTYLLGGGTAAAAVAAVVWIASCAQTPTSVTVHTFRQAQKVDVVCMKVNDPATGNLLAAPVPVEENNCQPVPLNTVGASLPYHLYAVVTQTSPGALAVVDLTGGGVVDVDRATPGIDFVPVGANPTDVAVSRDGKRTFVSSADPNKMAIYAIDNARLLGDSTGTSPPRPLQLPDIPVCALPQSPQALAVVPIPGPDAGAPSTPEAGEAGAADAGDAGTPAAGVAVGSDAGGSSSYALVALLRASAGQPAAVVTIDVHKLAAAPPGRLTPCIALDAVLGKTAMSADVPTSVDPGPFWPDGVPYADAGVTPVPPPVPFASQCSSGGVEVGIADAATGVASGDGGPSEGGIAGPPHPEPHPTTMALRDDIPILYVADDAVPLIHVIDLHDPSNPRELAPLVATSAADPTRRVAVGGIAIGPATHSPDYKTYLYAIDSRQGTLMVYDVTDPVTSPHTPLRRPHPELNPLAPPDRIGFSAPVVAVTLATHDWPVPSPNESPAVHQYTGLRCNPNPNAHPNATTFVDRGAYYRADQAALIQMNVTLGATVQNFPARLRGVFAFATLSNGTIVTIDVDDWDAPCRRPDPMSDGGVVRDRMGVSYEGGAPPGVLAIAQPEPTGPDDLDPYHVPVAYNSAIPESAAVTLEAFFPVSAPHRVRSAFLLRSDPSSGVHVPNVVGIPQLFNASGAPVSVVGTTANPLMLPTPLPRGVADPASLQNPTEPNPGQRTLAPGTIRGSTPTGDQDAGGEAGAVASAPAGIRLSFDDPTVHQDQDWAVTYEGVLPTVGGVTADIEPSTTDGGATDDYKTLTFAAAGARFCARGIEDWSIGQARAQQVLDELAKPNVGLPAPPAFLFNTPPSPPMPPLTAWTSDYVQITDDLLPASDLYWSQPATGNTCWQDLPAALSSDADPNAAANNRYNACLQTFGAAADADTHLARDLPILQAFDDQLKVGRFAWFPQDPKDPSGTVVERTTNRVIVAGDDSNKLFLRLTRCCFHHQAAFRVRTGGEWVVVGLNSTGVLHHVKAACGMEQRCELSTDPRDALMNARAFDIPWANWSEKSNVCTAAGSPTFDRNSPLAMRNPLFSFVMWAGCGPPAGYRDHTLSTRDLNWKFSVRGGFTPQTISLTAQGTSNAVSPQSTHFIRSLGQLAVVDGEAQGLVLIDLNLVGVSRSYF
jgi:hypothetical protein